MIDTAIKAAGVMVGILSVWLLVQAAWRRVFADETAAGASECPGWTCHSCSDRQQCVTKPYENDLVQDNSA